MSGCIIPFVSTGTYPVRTGNTLRPLIDGTAAFGRICAAIEASTSSIWLTVTFLWAEFEMPDGKGTLFDVLDKAAKRNVDVRIIFWRPDHTTAAWRRNAFW